MIIFNNICKILTTTADSFNPNFNYVRITEEEMVRITEGDLIRVTEASPGGPMAQKISTLTIYPQTSITDVTTFESIDSTENPALNYATKGSQIKLYVNTNVEISSGTIDNVAITNSNIDSTVIGATTRAEGNFANLLARQIFWNDTASIGLAAQVLSQTLIDSAQNVFDGAIVYNSSELKMEFRENGQWVQYALASQFGPQFDQDGYLRVGSGQLHNTLSSGLNYLDSLGFSTYKIRVVSALTEIADYTCTNNNVTQVYIEGHISNGFCNMLNFNYDFSAAGGPGSLGFSLNLKDIFLVYAFYTDKTAFIYPVVSLKTASTEGVVNIRNNTATPNLAPFCSDLASFTNRGSLAIESRSDSLMIQANIFRSSDLVLGTSGVAASVYNFIDCEKFYGTSVELYGDLATKDFTKPVIDAAFSFVCDSMTISSNGIYPSIVCPRITVSQFSIENNTSSGFYIFSPSLLIINGGSLGVDGRISIGKDGTFSISNLSLGEVFFNATSPNNFNLKALNCYFPNPTTALGRQGVIGDDFIDILLTQIQVSGTSEANLSPAFVCSNYTFCEDNRSMTLKYVVQSSGGTVTPNTDYRFKIDGTTIWTLNLLNNDEVSITVKIVREDYTDLVIITDFSTGVTQRNNHTVGTNVMTELEFLLTAQNAEVTGNADLLYKQVRVD